MPAFGFALLQAAGLLAMAPLLKTAKLRTVRIRRTVASFGEPTGASRRSDVIDQ